VAYLVEGTGCQGNITSMVARMGQLAFSQRRASIKDRTWQESIIFLTLYSLSIKEVIALTRDILTILALVALFSSICCIEDADGAQRFTVKVVDSSSGKIVKGAYVYYYINGELERSGRTDTNGKIKFTLKSGKAQINVCKGTTGKGGFWSGKLKSSKSPGTIKIKIYPGGCI